jgi:hypothetical protein
MQYLCLIYGAGQDLENDPALLGPGHLILAGVLEPAEMGAVQVRSDAVSIISDALQPGESLSGFALIEARDLNEAILVTSKLSAARMARVEVRTVRTSPPEPL